jgi:hypothetical protein
MGEAPGAWRGRACLWRVAGAHPVSDAPGDGGNGGARRASVRLHVHAVARGAGIRLHTQTVARGAGIPPYTHAVARFTRRQGTLHVCWGLHDARWSCPRGRVARARGAPGSARARTAGGRGGEISRTNANTAAVQQRPAGCLTANRPASPLRDLAGNGIRRNRSETVGVRASSSARRRLAPVRGHPGRGIA